MFFQETDKSLPGAVYLCSAGFVFASMILSMYLHFSLRGKKISEVVQTEERKIDYVPEKEMFDQKDKKISSDAIHFHLRKKAKP